MTETKWLIIAEASLLAAEMGLDHTHKTIRSWCCKGDLIAEKQTTRTGDRWVADRDSVITKVNFELEFKKQESRTVADAPSKRRLTSQGVGELHTLILQACRDVLYQECVQLSENEGRLAQCLRSHSEDT